MQNWRFTPLILLLFFSSCTKNNPDEKHLETATSGEFELIADEILKPVLDSLVYAFNVETPAAKVTVRYENATRALDDLLAHHCRLVIVGRSVTAKESTFLRDRNIELIGAQIAQNAIVCVVSTKSPYQSISIDSLKLLCFGRISDLTRVSSSYLSSTETILDSIFGLEKYQNGKILRFSTSDSILRRVKDDPKSIGFIGSSWWRQTQSNGDSSFRLLSLKSASGEQIFFHLANLLQGFYTLTSTVFAYTQEVPNTLPRGFLAYIMSADGQRILMNYDLLPKTQILKLVPASSD